MFKACSRVISVVVVAFSFFAAHPVHADGTAPPIIDEKLSMDCQNRLLGPVANPSVNEKIGHQYMLLLVFKKGQGAQYFGKPKLEQYGCIADVKTDQYPPVPSHTRILASNCPNDCVYPRGAYPAMNDGDDPLPPNHWGIVSAINSAPVGGGPGRRTEVWEIAVRDSCHAQFLYEFLTVPGGLLLPALENGDMLGELVVGYHIKNSPPLSPTLGCVKK